MTLNGPRRAIDVTLDPQRVWAEVGPYRARGLLVSVGAQPVWAPRLKVWSVSYRHGLDAIALAERFGYQVTVHEAGAVPNLVVSPPSSEAGPAGHLLDDDRRLW